MSRPIVLLGAAAAVAALSFPVAGAGAGTAPRDRDRDHMPDRWERANGLSVSRNDARRDRDRDGLRNLAEFRAGTDPRDADSDDDGVRDGAEDAGTVVSFTGGVLVIRTFGGQTVTGSVTARTKIECDGPRPARLRSEGRNGDDDNGGRGSGRGRDGDEAEGPRGDDTADRPEVDDDDQPATGPSGPTGATGPGEPGEDGPAGDCGAGALVAGARVDEAKLAVTSTGGVWRKVELAG